AQHHPAFQHDVDVDLDVAAGVDFAAQVEAGGVGQAHAGAHQRLGGASLVHALQASQLQRIVGALGLAGDGAGGDGGRPALVAGDREDVGEVVLALGVVVAQGRQPAAQVGGRGGDHAGVDQAHGALGGIGVLLLDDGLHAAVVTEQDAAIAGRVVQGFGQHRQAVAGGGEQAT